MEPNKVLKRSMDIDNKVKRSKDNDVAKETFTLSFLGLP